VDLVRPRLPAVTTSHGDMMDATGADLSPARELIGPRPRAAETIGGVATGVRVRGRPKLDTLGVTGSSPVAPTRRLEHESSCI
jgi:hypothetical protein